MHVETSCMLTLNILRCVSPPKPSVMIPGRCGLLVYTWQSTIAERHSKLILLVSGVPVVIWDILPILDCSFNFHDVACCCCDIMGFTGVCKGGCKHVSKLSQSCKVAVTSQNAAYTDTSACVSQCTAHKNHILSCMHMSPVENLHAFGCGL